MNMVLIWRNYLLIWRKKDAVGEDRRRRGDFKPIYRSSLGLARGRFLPFCR